jgi:hypothetical protein
MTIDIRSKLKLKSSGTSTLVSNDDPRSLFKKRATEVLERTYEDRGKRTKSTGMGKTIWDKEKLDKFGIGEFNCLRNGSYFIEVLPLGFEVGVPYSRSLSVHFQVGFAGDHFICNHRYSGSKCYRCEQQAKKFRETPRIPGAKISDALKALYPNDREGYLIWDRTAELLNGESPSSLIEVWNMPKKKVHEEIQSRVRDKITRNTLDISDLTPGGEGRTVAFEVTMEGTFPIYKGFDLIARTSPVTPEVAAKLATIIKAANEAGYKNAIDYLLHIPTYEEVKESMLTESEAGEPQAPDAPPSDHPSDNQPPSAGQPLRTPAPPAQHMSDEEVTAMLVKKYEDLQAKLTGMNAIQWMMWLKSDGKEYAESLQGYSKEAAIQMLIEALLEEDCLNHGIKL